MLIRGIDEGGGDVGRRVQNSKTHIYVCRQNHQYSVHSITRKICVVAIDTPTQWNITLLCVGKGSVRRAYKLKRNLLLSIDFQTPSQNVWYKWLKL